MAKLIKAATARKRAEAVDLTQQELDSIAGDIAFAAARGELSIVTCVKKAYEDEVVPALEKAGYVVTYPEYEYMLATFSVDSKAPKNWLQRTLTKLFGATSNEIADLYTPGPGRRYEEIHISWGPAYRAGEVVIVDSI